MRQAFFRSAYREGTAGWDVPGPQPALVMVTAEGLVAGPVLDLGCGTGENALFLDAMGYQVVGVDRIRRAVAAAQERAQARGAQALFLARDALAPAMPPHWAGTVIDSAFFHGLDARDRRRYWRTVAKVLRPGGYLHVLAFDDADLRRSLAAAPKAWFRGPWLRPAYFLLRRGEGVEGEPAVLATYRRTAAAQRSARRRPKRARRPYT